MDGNDDRKEKLRDPQVSKGVVQGRHQKAHEQQRKDNLMQNGQQLLGDVKYNPAMEAKNAIKKARKQQRDA